MVTPERSWLKRALGFGACLSVAVLAAWGGRFGAPMMPLCLAAGIVCGALRLRGYVDAGAQLAAGVGLRLGVALLGLQSVLIDAALVSGAFATALGVICAAIACGWGGARLLGLPRSTALVAGAAVGVCGVTAAVAVAGVVSSKSRDTLPLGAIVLWVSLLSSLAMIAWPPLANVAGLTDLEAGIAAGGSVHDVAQATAAGYAISPEAGAAAAVAKMARVALLTPLLAALMVGAGSGRFGFEFIPWYLPVFVVLAFISNMGWTPNLVQDLGALASRILLAAGLFAVGLRTRWEDLTGVGWRLPVLLTVQSATVIGVAYLMSMWLF